MGQWSMQKPNKQLRRLLFFSILTCKHKKRLGITITRRESAAGNNVMMLSGFAVLLRLPFLSYRSILPREKGLEHHQQPGDAAPASSRRYNWCSLLVCVSRSGQQHVHTGASAQATPAATIYVAVATSDPG